MLKPVLFLAVMLFICSSCKKTYTCHCNTLLVYKTSSNVFRTENFSGGPEAYSKKLNKKQAQDACSHMEVTIETNITNWATDNGKYGFAPGESITTNCEIILNVQ